MVFTTPFLGVRRNEGRRWCRLIAHHRRASPIAPIDTCSMSVSELQRWFFFVSARSSAHLSDSYRLPILLGGINSSTGKNTHKKQLCAQQPIFSIERKLVNNKIRCHCAVIMLILTLLMRLIDSCSANINIRRYTTASIREYDGLEA